jgi:hypothetical protein
VRFGRSCAVRGPMVFGGRRGPKAFRSNGLRKRMLSGKRRFTTLAGRHGWFERMRSGGRRRPATAAKFRGHFFLCGSQDRPLDLARADACRTQSTRSTDEGVGVARSKHKSLLYVGQRISPISRPLVRRKGPRTKKGWSVHDQPSLGRVMLIDSRPVPAALGPGCGIAAARPAEQITAEFTAITGHAGRLTLPPPHEP